MVVPFGVGVGDFVAVAKLTKDVVSELKKDSAAASHYQSLVVELDGLGSALSRIHTIEPGRHELPHLNAIRAAAAACQRPLENFSAKLKKYEGTMGTWNAREKRFEGIGERIKYGLTLERDVQELRATLGNQIATINMLLLTQVMESISAAETDRARTEATAARTLSLLEKGKGKEKEHQIEADPDLDTLLDGRKEVNADLETLKTGQETLKEHQTEANMNLKSLDQALEKLQQQIEQSERTNNDFRTELKDRARPKSSKLSSSITSLPHWEEESLQEDRKGRSISETDAIEREFECVERELGVQSSHGANTEGGPANPLSKSSVLETTSQLLKLVLSGTMIASAWMSVNQSQQIAHLSKQLISKDFMGNELKPCESLGLSVSGLHPNVSAHLLKSIPAESRPDTSKPIAAEFRPATSKPRTAESRPATSKPRAAKPGETKISPGQQNPGRPQESLVQNCLVPSFIVKIRDLTVTQGGLRLGSPSSSYWVPPCHNRCFTVGGSQIFRWKSGRVTTITNPPEFGNEPLTRHSVVSMFIRAHDVHILGVYIDASKSDVSESPGGNWQRLHFRHFKDSKDGYYSFLDFDGDKSKVAAPLPSNMVPQLIPRFYNAYRHRKGLGLIGKLPILIGIAALSAANSDLREVLTQCIRPGTWMSHDRPNEDRINRGIVVEIYYDAMNPRGSNKDVLESIEKGEHGPFYGP